MSYTWKQEEEFIQAVFGMNNLESALAHIAEVYRPVDVFGDELAGKIREDHSPDEIFTYEELAKWALENDFALA